MDYRKQWLLITVVDRMQKNIVASCSEGPERVRCGLGIAYIVLGKERFHAIGLKFIDQEAVENGSRIRILAIQPLGPLWG